MAVNYQSIGAYQEALQNHREFEVMAREDDAFIPFAVAAAQRSFTIVSTWDAATWNAYYEIGSEQARRHAAQEAHAAFWDAS